MDGASPIRGDVLVHSVPDLRDKKNRSGFSNPLIFSKFSGNHPLIHPIIFSPSGSPSLIFFAFRVQHPLFFLASQIVSLRNFCFRVQIMGSKFKGPSDTPEWKFHAGVLEVEPSGASQNAGTGGGVPQHLPKRWYRGFHLWYL